MADDKSNKPGGSDEDVEDVVSDADSDTVKIPDEAEAEPANVEGSEAQRPQ